MYPGRKVFWENLKEIVSEVDFFEVGQLSDDFYKGLEVLNVVL